ncbi:MAG: hypothetical protein KKE62_01870 [Proteobacteria bacterium]|nr:hypothetical protein [Pseudomonadota bacterium]MBU1387114.1 hypothetical protein [Pseudomonadota bacterium]MBU1541569.1 hypothetical protein [Pseudomonadota bacterium]MBU2429094.1 hypothetical protein [Pseudomonadota bacterium]MBU2482761.1 hypothetical protein [Pseudomonadota bacterium]
MPQQKRRMIILTENGKKKWCAKCQDYHPADLSTFYQDLRSKTGLSSWCRKSQVKGTQSKEPDVVTSTETPQVEIQDKAAVLELDFSEYTCLHEWLVNEAWANVRTPTEQAMWLIMSGKKEKEQHEIR